MCLVSSVVSFLGDQTSVYWLIFVWMSRLMMTSLLRKCFIEDKVLERVREKPNWLIIQVSDCFWRDGDSILSSLIYTHTHCSMFDHGNWTKSRKKEILKRKKKDKRGNISSYVQVPKIESLERNWHNIPYLCSDTFSNVE